MSSKLDSLLSYFGLGCSPFARHYLGNNYYFLFLQLLRCFSSPGLPAGINTQLSLSSIEWVSPFGDLRVKGCLPPHRNLSQAATSFIVFLCQGIHHTPLLRFSHTFTLKCLIIGAYIANKISVYLYLYLTFLLKYFYLIYSVINVLFSKAQKNRFWAVLVIAK